MVRRWEWLGGIRRKMAISFSLLVSAIAAFVVLFFPNRLEQQARDALIARAESVRDMTAYSLSAALLFGDTVGVKDVVSGAARDQQVTLLDVRDRDGTITRLRRDPKAIATRGARIGVGYVTADGSTYISSAPIMHGDSLLGTLVLGISLAELRADVRHSRRLGLLVGSVILLVGVLVVYAVSTVLTGPLLDVVDSVRRIAAGDLSVRAPTASDANVAQLAHAVNYMVDKLAGAQGELAGINAALEERVRVRTAELNSLIDLAPAAIVAMDLDWRVMLWNRAATALFQYTADEVMGKPNPLVGSEQTAEFRRHQAALAEARTMPPVEVVRVRKDGTPVNVLLSAGALIDSNGRPIGYLGFITDLTERKSLEEQLRQAQKMEAVGRLAGGIAHDFNNILTVITGCAALLKESKLRDDQREDVGQIAIAADRASSLTRQLLTFSRQEVVHLELVNLSDMVHAMGPMLRRLLRENIRVTTTLGLDVGPVMADERQVEQVLMNLVVNAADAMPDGGKLHIETDLHYPEGADARRRSLAERSYVKLSVRDTGSGIDAETMQKIFDPFFTTKEVGKGTGLGLATVYTVVTQLDGFIDVDSSKGNGATFNVYLPLAPVQPAIASVIEEVSAPVATGTETVLLVEDEEPVRRLLRRSLEQLGYSVIEASSGETALKVAEAHYGSIDVVVTDLMMPGMNGRDFADRLNAKHPDLRVVFMSGYIEESIRQRTLVDDSHAFMQKPFTGVALGQTIRSLLDRSPLAAPA